MSIGCRKHLHQEVYIQLKMTRSNFLTVMRCTGESERQAGGKKEMEMIPTE